MDCSIVTGYTKLNVCCEHNGKTKTTFHFKAIIYIRSLEDCTVGGSLAAGHGL